MSKAIKTQIMFNKKLTYFEPTIPDKVVPQLLSPFAKVSLHLEEGRRYREKSASPQRQGSLERKSL
jgi:hypothetical protein